MAITPVTDATFEAEVLQSDIPVLVDFWAEWCGPCKQLAPTLEELSTRYEGRSRFVKLNVEENLDAPARYGVRVIPALFMFRDGESVSSKVGALPRKSLESWIDETI